MPHSPLMNCYALVYKNHICIYSMKDSYRDNVIKLRKNVTLKHFNVLFKDIKKLKKVFFEPASTPFILKSKITGQHIKLEKVCNPITLLKAKKNPIELKGSIRSHEKDGLALLRFIKWFKSTKIDGGLMCYHPYATVINAKSIGKNFQFRNSLTIGNKHNNNSKIPVIGNNVVVGANSVIIGDINIGEFYHIIQSTVVG